MSDKTHLLGVSFLYDSHFGFATPPSQTNQEDVRNIALALLTATNGDGKLTDEERAWIVGYFAAKGYPAELVEEARTMAPIDVEKVAPLMSQGTLKFSGRVLIYDAIRAASADGAFAEGERATVYKIATALGVGKEVVDQIAQLVVEEEALKEKRIKLLMPQGHPNLHARYKPA